MVNEVIDYDRVVDTFTFSGEDDSLVSTTVTALSVSRAVSYLAGTVQENWGKTVFVPPHGDVQHSVWQTIVEDLRADMSTLLSGTSIETASIRFLRGMSILTEHPRNPSGLDDLTKALEAVELHFPKTRDSPEEGIVCVQMMTACFLVLRDPWAFVSSIQSQLEALWHQNQKLAMAQRRFALALKNGAILCREDKALMDLWYSRLCATLATFESIDSCFFTTHHRQAFQNLILGRTSASRSAKLPRSVREDQDDLAAALFDLDRWDRLRVYKMATVGTVAVAAVPTAVALILDPWLAAAAAVGSVRVAPRVRVLSKRLQVFDQNKRNLYHLRKHILHFGRSQKSIDFPMTIEANEQADDVENFPPSITLEEFVKESVNGPKTVTTEEQKDKVEGVLVSLTTDEREEVIEGVPASMTAHEDMEGIPASMTTHVREGETEEATATSTASAHEEASVQASTTSTADELAEDWDCEIVYCEDYIN